ncbi:MAG: Dyp-type peroxidase [Steroidobacteraceae bacterium]
MTAGASKLDFSDIQGNILRGYRSFHFARFMFFRIEDASGGREFLGGLLRFITPAEWGEERPTQATNVAINFAGLRSLGLPLPCLASFPVEFQQGMRVRAKALGDTDESDPERWDDPWRTGGVDVVVMVYANEPARRQARSDEILLLARTINSRFPTAQISELQHQDAQWLTIDGELTRKEHFGFTDGISNPDVEGVAEGGIGQDIGNPTGPGVFRQVPVGEFILGYPGEGGEVAPMPLPRLLGYNATYLVIRKLRQEVTRFRSFLAMQANFLNDAIAGALAPDVLPAEFLSAKMFGRWPDGSPLIEYPDRAGGDPSNGFGYAEDPSGARCPLGAHIRRVYPRDSLGFGGKLVNRRRLIRRGIAYGDYLPPGKEDGEERGIMFLAFNSGFDQFEFVQQNWINQGDDFQQGNDMDPIAGSQTNGRMMIPGDATRRRRPFLCFDIPRFVATKGGDYFFVPSLTGLRLIASGQVRVS